MIRFSLVGFVVLLVTLSGFAQLNNGSDGSDGDFNPTSNILIDLSLAPTGVWTAPGNGNGIYDPEKWAIVFKFRSLNIPANVTVSFRNHPSRAPVIWLVQEDAIIAGQINIHGEDASNQGFSEPGPGGFRGGRPPFGAGITSPSAGLGPGGGHFNEHFGAYGVLTPPNNRTYGNEGVFPLIGGSGGAGSVQSAGGGGGGAILIASNTTLRLSGHIQAYYNSGINSFNRGSGGAVRLQAFHIIGNGNIVTGDGVNIRPGRVRLEGNTAGYVGGTVPAASLGPIQPIFPDLSAPSVTIARVGTSNVSTDPRAGHVNPDAIIFQDTTSVTIRIEAKNVPSTWRVYVRMVPFQGDHVIVDATRISGNDSNSIYEAIIPNFPTVGTATMQARAVAP